MTFAAHVKGGTGAGRKRQREAHEWAHHCTKAPAENGITSYSRLLRSYSCPDCGTRRP